MSGIIGFALVGIICFSVGLVAGGVLGSGKTAELEGRLLEIELRLEGRNAFVERAFDSLSEIAQLGKRADAGIDDAISIARGVVSETVTVYRDAIGLPKSVAL